MKKTYLTKKDYKNFEKPLKYIYTNGARTCDCEESALYEDEEGINYVVCDTCAKKYN